MPDYTNVCYKKAYLSEVIARIDFVAPISGLDKPLPEKLANAVTKHFPITEPSEAIGQEFQIGPGLGEVSTKETRFKQWNFFGREREKQLTISAASVFTRYQQYTTYDDLREEFSATIEAFTKSFSDTRTGRFGLRYVNNIEVQNLPNPFAWNALIAPKLLGTVDFFQSPERLTRLFHIAELKSGDLDVRFQFGFPNPDYPAPIKRPLFVIDIDAYIQIAHDLPESIQYMDKAHAEIQTLFENSITDTLRGKMNG